MNRVSDFQCVSSVWRAQMETGRREREHNARVDSLMVTKLRWMVMQLIRMHGNSLCLCRETQTQCLQIHTYTHKRTCLHFRV